MDFCVLWLVLNVFDCFCLLSWLVLDEFVLLWVAFCWCSLVLVGVHWFSLVFVDVRWFWLASLVGFASLKLGIHAFGSVMLDLG